MSRCQCGCWIRKCKNCGATPGEQPDLFDPKRLARSARINERVERLFVGRGLIDGFIDDCCKGEVA